MRENEETGVKKQGRKGDLGGGERERQRGRESKRESKQSRKRESKKERDRERKGERVIDKRRMTINKTFKLTLLHPTSIERWSNNIISNCCYASSFIFRQCVCILLGFTMILTWQLQVSFCILCLCCEHGNHGEKAENESAPGKRE